MKKVSHKIIALVVLSNILIALVVAGIAYYNIVLLNQQSIKKLKDNLMIGFDKKVQFEVETVITMLQEIDNKRQRGEMSLVEAKKLGADLLRSARYDQEGYFWADTTNGVNVVLLGRDAEGKNRYEAKDVKGNYFIKEIIKKGMREGGGFSEWWFTKKDGVEALPKRGYSLLFKPFGWVIGTGNYIDDINVEVQQEVEKQNQSLRQSVLVLFGLTSLFIVLICAPTVFVSMAISKPVNQIAELFNLAEKGDLTVCSRIESQDEIGQLSRAFNSMLEKFRNIVSDAKNLSVSLAASSEEMMASTEEVSKSSEQIANAMADLARGASEQARATEQSTKQVGAILEGLEKISGEMNQSEAIVKNAEDNLNTGQKAVRLQEEKMAESKQMTEKVARAIAELSDQSAEIGDIVEVIKGIAGQTKLLALNATIEAARSGEQGRSFAVVADSIRNLAGQSSISTDKIASIIKEVQTGVGNAVTEMEKAKLTIGEQENSIHHTTVVFNEIYTSVKTVSNNIKAVSGATEELSANAKQIGDIIHDIAAISEETAAGSEQVAASGEEQTAIAFQIAKSSEELAGMATRLENNIRRFKV